MDPAEDARRALNGWAAELRIVAEQVAGNRGVDRFIQSGGHDRFREANAKNRYALYHAAPHIGYRGLSKYDLDQLEDILQGEDVLGADPEIVFRRAAVLERASACVVNADGSGQSVDELGCQTALVNATSIWWWLTKLWSLAAQSLSSLRDSGWARGAGVLLVSFGLGAAVYWLAAEKLEVEARYALGFGVAVLVGAPAGLKHLRDLIQKK